MQLTDMQLQKGPSSMVRCNLKKKKVNKKNSGNGIKKSIPHT